MNSVYATEDSSEAENMAMCSTNEPGLNLPLISERRICCNSHNIIFTKTYELQSVAEHVFLWTDAVVSLVIQMFE